MADNCQVQIIQLLKSHELSFLFITHGFDEIHLSLKFHLSISSGCSYDPTFTN